MCQRRPFQLLAVQLAQMAFETHCGVIQPLTMHHIEGMKQLERIQI